MTIQGNLGALTGAADPEDISLGELLDILKGTTDLPLVFSYDGRDVQPGYHVTEVKAGRFEALDCGANPESWTEIFIQLWDVDEDRAHMPAGKFVKIIGKVIEHVALDQGARLTFEVSDGERPMQLHRAALPRIEDGQLRVALSARPASCKPRDRWLEEQKSCSATAGAKPCCG
ncbi:DUF6428 family protein [Haematobacter missouriensis]|uniref:Uncharacterized protein n=1 Tax=Haematobacter missouriensis TaxID=366616 RepID=A0ABX3ZWD4_9RHOB|nr:DUF6428 family protein [Haematobacter missouriensis]OWJ77994.1 hypothetical protein CDV53_04580 [Haematobacter missouriensis]